jgi:hypothetical protein
MAERYTKQMFEEDRRKAEEKQRREAGEREKASAYASWTAAGGDPASFEQEWPRLANERRRRRVLDADEEARATHRASGISGI